MNVRFSVIFPALGLLLFAMVTVRSAGMNEHDSKHPRKYFWWSSLRLDTDPLNRHRPAAMPCPDEPHADCSGWDLLPNQWVDPSIFDRVFIVSAFPAFVAGTGIVALSSKRGADEVLVFMVSMPMLIFLWYYFAGWLIDRGIYRLRTGSSSRNAPLKIV
jgi:hypothetical protein